MSLIHGKHGSTDDQDHEFSVGVQKKEEFCVPEQREMS